MMNNSISPLSYRFVVAHLAPGFLALLPLSVYIPQLNNLIKLTMLGNGTLSSSFGLLVIALIFGLIIDGICYVTLSFLVEKMGKVVFHQEEVRIKLLNINDFDFLDRVYSRTFSWSQLYTSSSFVFFLIFYISITEEIFNDNKIIIASFVIAIILLFSAAHSLSKCNQFLNDKFE